MYIIMTSNRMKTFKVIVQGGKKNSLDIAQYIDENIRAVNNLGIIIRMEKISEDEMDAEMVEALRKRGITRLPALLTNEGKVFVGKDKIMDLFDRGIRGQRRGARLDPGDVGYGGNTEMGSNPDMTDFWMRELYAGQDPRSGKMLPRKDKDEGEDEGADIEKRLRDYQRNVPKHRRADARDKDIDMDAVQQQRRRGRRKTEPDPDDNIADVCDNCGHDPCDCEDDDYGGREPVRGGRPTDTEPRGGTVAGLGGDAMDDKMLTAWMQNNPGGSDY